MSMSMFGGMHKENPMFPLAARVKGACFGFAIMAMMGASSAMALQLPSPSPAARVKQEVGVTKISVRYSSPGVKGRAIWGKLVPYQELWRTGANAATILSVSHDVQIGGKTLKAGKYSLLTIPTQTTWTVLFNRNTKLNGTRGYDKTQNALELTVTPTAIPHRERMTFLFANTTDTTTELHLEWEKVRIAVSISVDTKAHALANINKALATPWRSYFMAARYLFSVGDLTTAETLINQSIQLKSVWWNHWVKSSIMAKKGDIASALHHAKEMMKLGANDPIYVNFFKARMEQTVATWSKKSK